MLLRMSVMTGTNLSIVHPKLFTSVLRIFAHHIPQSSRREEALTNMAISCQGSIRKAAHIVTIAKLSTNLRALGDMELPRPAITPNRWAEINWSQALAGDHAP